MSAVRNADIWGTRSLATKVAMLWPVGLLPGPRATYGSAVTVAVGWFLPVPPLWGLVAILVLGSAVAIWTAGEAEHVLGHDANPIIVDEVIGQSIALFLVPHRLVAFVVSFFLFRVLDVLKPLGASGAQAFPGGYGVVADDMIAGATACVAFHVLRFALLRAGHPVLG